MDTEEPTDRDVFDREVYRPAPAWRFGAAVMVALGVISVVTLGARAVMNPGPMALVVVAGIAVVLGTADSVSGTVTLTMDHVRIETLLRAHRVAWEHCRGVRVVTPGRAANKWIDPLLGGLCGGAVMLFVPRIHEAGFIGTLGVTYVLVVCTYVPLRLAVLSLLPGARRGMHPVSGITVVDRNGRSFRIFGQLEEGDAVRLRNRLRRLGVETLIEPLV